MINESEQFIRSFKKIQIIIQQSARLGAAMALVKCGRIKPYLKKNEAYRRFGRAKIERWIDAGAVTIRKDGDHSAAWRLDLVEILTLCCVEKLHENRVFDESRTPEIYGPDRTSSAPA